MPKTFNITWECVRSGQVRPYADSIYEYILESDANDEIVKSFCTNVLEPAKHEGSNFSGSSAFPHGLDAFYRFTKTDSNKYNYIVCRPYTC